MRWAYRLALGMVLLTGANAWAKDAVRDSVVKIHVKNRFPDLYRPWAKDELSELKGSGVIIDGNRILTNAHVVRHASQVFVQPSQSNERYSAKVGVVSTEMDLALVTVDDKSFFQGRKPLPLDKTIPRVRDTVHVYGFPIGGNQLSTTKGIISRIEHVALYEQIEALRIQVDAALNPGNSGGPAVVKDKIVGLVFSGIPQADNIGYLIASEEIVLFLKDAADGKYDGKPQLNGGVLQIVENEALRAKLGLTKGTGGLMVTQEPYSRPSEPNPLKQWDVITHVGDHPIDQRGMVAVRDDLRLGFQYIIPKEAKDGKIRMKVLRRKKNLDLDVPVPRGMARLIPYLRNKYPSYFVHGPLVFSIPSQEMLSSLLSEDEWAEWLQSQNSPMLHRQHDPPSFPGEELVVLVHPPFPHRISKGYDGICLPVIKTINKTKVKNLVHLVELIRDAKDEFLTITFHDRAASLVFRRQELLDATDEILADEGIRNRCSPDLKAVWEGKKKTEE